MLDVTGSFSTLLFTSTSLLFKVEKDPYGSYFISKSLFLRIYFLNSP